MKSHSANFLKSNFLKWVNNCNFSLIYLNLFFFPPPPQAKPKLIEPIDYENVIVQRKTQILNDALREMLLFPYDDFQVI